MAQLSHLWFAGRWRVGTVIRVPVDPSVHPVPMLLGTKSTSRDVTPPPPKNNNQGISNFKYLVALAGLLPICLLVARLAGLPWEVLSTRNQVRALSTKVNDASIQTFPILKILVGDEVYLVARQELLVDNRMHCVVLGGDRLYAEVVRAEMNKMHIRNSLYMRRYLFSHLNEFSGSSKA